MSHNFDVLYANFDLLKDWMAKTYSGLPVDQELAQQERLTLAARVKSAFMGLSAGLEGKIEQKQSELKRYLIEGIFLANQLVAGDNLEGQACSYCEAQEREAAGQRIRYVLIQGRLSYPPPPAEKPWLGDIIADNQEDPDDLSRQHLVYFDHEKNSAQPPRGMHARQVIALTFWRETFQSSGQDWLSACQAVLVWEEN